MKKIIALGVVMLFSLTNLNSSFAGGVEHNLNYITENQRVKIDKVVEKIVLKINCNRTVYVKLINKIDSLTNKLYSKSYEYEQPIEILRKKEILGYIYNSIKDGYQNRCWESGDLDLFELGVGFENSNNNYSDKKGEFSQKVDDFFEARYDKSFVYFYYENDEVIKIKNDLSLFSESEISEKGLNKSSYPRNFLGDEIVKKFYIHFLNCENDNSLIGVSVYKKDFVIDNYIYDINKKSLIKLNYGGVTICKKGLKGYYFNSSITDPETRLYLYDGESIKLIYDFFANSQDSYGFDLMTNGRLKIKYYDYNFGKRDERIIDVSNY